MFRYICCNTRKEPSNKPGAGRCRKEGSQVQRKLRAVCLAAVQPLGVQAADPPHPHHLPGTLGELTKLPQKALTIVLGHRHAFLQRGLAYDFDGSTN